MFHVLSRRDPLSGSDLIIGCDCRENYSFVHDTCTYTWLKLVHVSSVFRQHSTYNVNNCPDGFMAQKTVTAQLFAQLNGFIVRTWAQLQSGHYSIYILHWMYEEPRPVIFLSLAWMNQRYEILIRDVQQQVVVKRFFDNVDQVLQ